MNPDRITLPELEGVEEGPHIIPATSSNSPAYESPLLLNDREIYGTRWPDEEDDQQRDGNDASGRGRDGGGGDEQEDDGAAEEREDIHEGGSGDVKLNVNEEYGSEGNGNDGGDNANEEYGSEGNDGGGNGYDGDRETNDDIDEKIGASDDSRRQEAKRSAGTVGGNDKGGRMGRTTVYDEFVLLEKEARQMAKLEMESERRGKRKRVSVSSPSGSDEAGHSADRTSSATGT